MLIFQEKDTLPPLAGLDLSVEKPEEPEIPQEKEASLRPLLMKLRGRYRGCIDPLLEIDLQVGRVGHGGREVVLVTVLSGWMGYYLGVS